MKKRKKQETVNQSEYLQQSCACSYRCSDLSGKPRKSNGRNKMKKIWITGAEGHIGTALLDLLEGVEYQLLPTDIEEVDITKIDEVTQFVHVNRPDVVINCAGLTDVQECENNVDEAYRVNAIGVRNVALAANEVNAKVIQISTDDVFDKESRVPYNEFDNVHPRTIYGKQKKREKRF